MLRRSEREVLVLCVWEGLEYAEAAECLGIPLGTVVFTQAITARATVDGMTQTPTHPA